MDLIKLPFFVWFSSPNLQGYKKLYEKLITNYLIRYTNAINAFVQRGVEFVNGIFSKKEKKEE